MKASELRKKRPGMSIVIALRCKECFVVGSDSRLTESESDARDDSRKIRIVRLKDAGAIIATAGDADPAASIIENTEKRFNQSELTQDDTPKQLLEESIRDYKRTQAELNWGGSVELAQKSFVEKGIKTQFVLCYFFKGIPRMYATDGIVNAQCFPKDYPYWCLGVGRDVANYLLKGLPIANMDSQHGTYTAVSIIKEIKNNVSGCGGPTQIGLVSAGHLPQILSAESIQEREKIVSDFDKQISERKQSLRESIEKAGFEYNAPGWSAHSAAED